VWQACIDYGWGSAGIDKVVYRKYGDQLKYPIDEWGSGLKNKHTQEKLIRAESLDLVAVWQIAV
jgi:hypothetical protein